MRLLKTGLIFLAILTTNMINGVGSANDARWGAQVLAKKSDPRSLEASKLFQQGVEQFQTSQFEVALQSFQKTLAIYRETSDSNGEGLTLNYIALTYGSLGQYPQALEFYQQVLVKFRKIGGRTNEGTVLNNIAGIYASVGQYSQALDFYQQALDIRYKNNAIES
jgi:tetratricopeptide (TPR) repeat protein